MSSSEGKFNWEKIQKYFFGGVPHMSELCHEYDSCILCTIRQNPNFQCLLGIKMLKHCQKITFFSNFSKNCSFSWSLNAFFNLTESTFPQISRSFKSYLPRLRSKKCSQIDKMWLHLALFTV